MNKIATVFFSEGDDGTFTLPDLMEAAVEAFDGYNLDDQTYVITLDWYQPSTRQFSMTLYKKEGV